MKRPTLAAPAVLLLGLVAASSAAAQPPAEKTYMIRTRTEAFVKTHALDPDAKDDDQRKLRKEKLAAALGELTGRTRDFLRDEALTDRLLDSGLRVLEAELEYYNDPGERVRVLERHLEISRELATILEHRAQAELATEAQVQYARFCRSSVALALQKARREAGR